MWISPSGLSPASCGAVSVTHRAVDKSVQKQSFHLARPHGYWRVIRRRKNGRRRDQVKLIRSSNFSCAGMTCLATSSKGFFFE